MTRISTHLRRQHPNLEQEFESLIAEHTPLIYRVCYTYGSHDPAVVADLYQETCLALWEQLPHFRHDSHTRTWVYRIAFNTACAYYRSWSSRHPVDLVSPELLQAVEVADEETNRREVLYRLIDQLSDSDRITVQLQLDGNSYEEMAELLGTTPDGVRGRLRRAKEKLKAMYRDYQHHEES